MSKKTVGQNIRKARKQKGLTQLQLAKALKHKSAAYINYIEAGERNIDLATFIKLLKVLEQSFETITGHKPLLGEEKEYKIIDKYGIPIAKFKI